MYLFCDVYAKHIQIKGIEKTIHFWFLTEDIQKQNI